MINYAHQQHAHRHQGGNRHGQGQLVKADGEERNENYKDGKLVNFTVTKPAE